MNRYDGGMPASSKGSLPKKRAAPAPSVKADAGDEYSRKSLEITVEGMKLWESFTWPSDVPDERVRFAGILFLQALQNSTRRPWEQFVERMVHDHLTQNIHPGRVALACATFARNWRAWSKRSRVESAQVLAFDAIWTLMLREIKGPPIPVDRVRAFARAAKAIAKARPLKGEKERIYGNLVGWVQNNADGTKDNLRMIVSMAIYFTYDTQGPGASELSEAIVDHLWEHGVHVGKRDLVRENLKLSKSADHERLMNAILRAMNREPPRSGARKG